MILKPLSPSSFTTTDSSLTIPPSAAYNSNVGTSFDFSGTLSARNLKFINKNYSSMHSFINQSCSLVTYPHNPMNSRSMLS